MPKENFKTKKMNFGRIPILHTDNAATKTAGCKFTLRIHLESCEDLLVYYFTKDLIYIKKVPCRYKFQIKYEDDA